MRLVALLVLLLMVTSPLPTAADTVPVIPDSIPTIPDDTVSAVAPTTADEAPVYPMDEARKAKLISYSRFRSIWRFADFFISIGVLALLLFTGLSARFRNWAQVARKRFFVVWLFLALILIAEYLLRLPFDVYRGFIVESNYGFMNQSFGGWLGDSLLELLLTAVIAIIPMWFLYRAIGCMKRWWLAFSLGAIPFLIFFIIIAPVVITPLFNDFEPVKDKVLESKLLALADKAGIEGSDVFEVNASEQSSKINAYVTGLFGSKRIVLYDTMIKNFTHDEILFVMGHEMGHYVKNHIFWGVGMAILMIFFALFLIDKTIHPVIRRFRRRFGFETLSDIASLPLLLIFVTVFMFLSQPVTNAVSRSMERACDKYGMDITRVDGETAAIAFDKLAVYNLSDPDPSAIVEFWFYSHPALVKRMAFVRGYTPEPLLP